VEEQDEPKEVTHHIEQLAADADDLMALLTRQHEEGGDLHPEALGKAARLQTSLHAVLNALTKHEHIAMGAEDVWRTFSREHRSREV
jgi:hypothetical protein